MSDAMVVNCIWILQVACAVNLVFTFFVACWFFWLTGVAKDLNKVDSNMLTLVEQINQRLEKVEDFQDGHVVLRGPSL